MARPTSQELRKSLSHPVVDADGHQLEFEPVLFEYLKEEGGADFVERIRESFRQLFAWYTMDPDERRRIRAIRPPWGLQTARPEDIATCMAPALFRKRMDEMGLDFAFLYPTMAISFVRNADREAAMIATRAVNRFYRDSYADHADRLAPAGIVPMNNPADAIAALDHAVGELGLKTVVIDCAVPRPVPALAERLRDLPRPLARFLTWLDCYGVDSEHDYDPFWRRCLELGIAPTAHMAGMWGTRGSISSYVHNHMGMFGAANEGMCRSLFLAGVTFRFPELQIGFLEGGAGWACSLFADLIEHWERRNLDEVATYDPARLDRDKLAALLREHDPRFARHLDRPLDEVCRTLFALSGWVPEAGWDPRNRDLLDEFARCRIGRAEDVRDHFVPNFFFGCEAEDPSVGWALDGRSLPFGAKLQVMFGSDIGHWDVADIRTVLVEAHEAVEHGRIDEAGFRAFAFENVVRLHGRGNPGAFRGTAIQDAAAAVLATGGRTGER